ncbi:uncharacterized protein LOC127079938 [Lathyrus oleraceus]|uniref:uncharacterized protein LOC127079938 n=1 Tax=Pisum sativum TaxID=3888 RepID=UPI0021CED1DC|nr:uncharacterized protein LOC127079938 [Pisum sativum]
MVIPDDEILDVVPLSIIPCEAIDLNQPIDASASACSNQGNSSSIPSSSTPATNSMEDIHHTDRVVRDLVTRILNKGHSVKGVSTPLSQMYPSPEVEQHSGKTVSEKGKSVASKTANASRSEKHDDANVVIDLEDGSFDGQEENLLHHLEPSVAKRMKTHKGRSVAELMSARKAKKAAEKGGCGKGVGKYVVDVKEVMDLIKVAGLLKTVVGFCHCYKGLVKEFIVNILEDIADKNSKEFCKVFVRARQVNVRLVKKHLPAGKLTVKYAILHKIGAANWVPTNHISTIANTLGSLEQAEGENVEHAKEAEAHTSSERSTNNDETSGNSVSGADEVASSSSTE